MKTGTFVYIKHDGGRGYLAVRDCPDPAKARAFLESLTGQPVRWMEATR